MGKDTFTSLNLNIAKCYEELCDQAKMNHIYFTSIVNGAGLAASLAKGNGRERVYIVEPTGGI